MVIDGAGIGLATSAATSASMRELPPALAGAIVVVAGLVVAFRAFRPERASVPASASAPVPASVPASASVPVVETAEVPVLEAAAR